MDQQTSPSIFDINLDEEGKFYLTETAKWGKILAITGLVLGGLAVLAGLMVMFMGSAFNQLVGSSSAMIGAAGFVYVVAGALYFYPSIQLLKFSNAIPEGFRKGDQVVVTQALSNLKTVFKFWGVLTVVIIILYALILVGGIIFGVAMG